MVRKVDDYRRVVLLLSQNKVAGVSRILSVALRNGSSAISICARLQAAINGTYSPLGGWTPHDFDVAFLVKALGGPRLLYVLQKEEGYPSLTTLRKQKKIPEITISTGRPSKPEFDANIHAFLGAETGHKPPPNLHVGQILMMDGVALEEICRFDLQRNCVLGLCREHSGDTKTTVDDVGDVHRIHHDLYKKKTIHHGKDGTVVGIAPISGRTNYFVSPLVLSPSCKTKKGIDLAQWIPNLISAYQQHPDGETRHGPINTLATDGESSFRNLRFAIGMTDVLDPLSKEGEIIYRLPGMNRRTGARGLITTSDPKHIVKRFATLIRSPSGIQISDSLITTEMVGEALLLLDNMPHEKVEQLLHPADKQNVPKAVNLLQSLFDLAGKHYTVTPAILERVQRVVFLAKVLSCFLFPFIKVEMSLSEQLRSLSTYTHLLTAIYRKHRTAFVTSALYADSQAIVKNIIITVARMQTLDPTLDYHILFEGTDQLEGVFSHVRTQDHARNFDILQLAHKLSIGAEINAIFERCPDLDRGHIRRNLINARGVDHINPKSWIGDVCVGKVNIYNEYMAGRAAANKLLVEQFGHTSNASVDFDILFSNPKIDHLRPFGRYIGSNLDMDEDEQPVEPADAEVNEDDEDDKGLTFTDPNMSTVNSEPTHDLDSLPDTRDCLDDLEATENILHLEPEELNPIPEQPSQKILVDGVYVPKPTVVAKVLSSEEGKKVTTRSLRARGIAISDALRRLQNLNQPMENASSDNLIKSGDLGAFLVRVGDDVCLAVAEVLSFQKGTSKQPFSSIHCDDLDATGSGLISIAIQVLHLHPKIAEDSGELIYV